MNKTKFGTIRPTKKCAKFYCNGDGCYEKFVRKCIFGKWHDMWELYCKKLKKAERQAIKIAGKL